MYLAAYNYIINDSINANRVICVADVITDLDMYEWDGLKDYPKERKKLHMYRSERGYEYFEPYYCPLLFFLFRNKNAENSDTIVFFSPIVDSSMLRADLMFYDEGSKGRSKFRHEAYVFGMSYEYLFLFNEDGYIKKALGRYIIMN